MEVEEAVFVFGIDPIFRFGVHGRLASMVDLSNSKKSEEVQSAKDFSHDMTRQVGAVGPLPRVFVLLGVAGCERQRERRS